MNIHALLSSLSVQEKEELYLFLKQETSSVPNVEQVRNSTTTEQAIICPHCHSLSIFGHGAYKGRKRYKCKDCGKTFNELTGTAISGIKKVDKFQEYIQIVIESVSIREAAKRLQVNIKTAFDWRHKLLSSVSVLNGQSFEGIVECDDKQVEFNEKGSRHLERKSYKRPSDRQKKRGISNDKVSLMVATDRNGHPMMRVAKIGRIDVESVEETIGSFLDKSNVVCSDSHPSIVAWAKNKDLEHHTFIASKQHIKDKCYHVQHINALDSLYEKWVKRFNGVATKYLPQYLNWFILLRKLKQSINPILDFVKVLSTNTQTITMYREIETEYKKLFNLQYSKT